jgi:hypothetical protein
MNTGEPKTQKSSILQGGPITSEQVMRGLSRIITDRGIIEGACMTNCKGPEFLCYYAGPICDHMQ